jgi:hypothetical protein
MDSTIVGLISIGCIFAGSLVGLGLQRLLPGHHLSKETQDVVKLSAGTIATLTALVLGLLVSSAKSSFDAINSSIVQTSVKIIVLDRALAAYGTETKPAREQIKGSVATLIDVLWPQQKGGGPVVETIEQAKGGDLVRAELQKLTPANETQRQILAQAQQTLSDVAQIRWLAIEQAQNQLPVALLVILIFWLTLLFVSFGMFAPPHITSIIVLFVGACAVSAAIFLVLELNRPLDGMIKVSSAPMRHALRQVAQ